MIADADRHDRVRIMESMMRVAATRGYEAATVDEVIGRAGVGAATFDRLFAGKEDCFLQSYDSGLDLLVARVTTAWNDTERRPWPERVTAALRSLLQLFAAEADIARMAIVDVTALGEEARMRYQAAADRFVSFVDAGRALAPEAGDLPPETARFVIGAAAASIFHEIRGGRGPGLERKLPDLVFTITMPYLGVAGAEAEMQRVAGQR